MTAARLYQQNCKTGLRNDFVAELDRAMPTFIIDVHAKTTVTGIDTTYDFLELEAFIKKHYSKDYTGNGFNILKRSVLEEERDKPS